MDINTDTNGLVAREHLNRTNEKYDYTKWVVEILNPAPGMKLLDIGCGTGKQIFSVAEKVMPNGFINGLDASSESLGKVRSKCNDMGYKHIEVFCHDIDEACNVFQDHKFDIIYSSYAFYYSKDMVALLEKLKNNLTDNGKIVLFGPGANSNSELIKVIKETTDVNVEYYMDFLSPEELESTFSDVRVEKLENIVLFKELNDFKRWFDTSELYKAEDSDEILTVIKEIIRSQGAFGLTKETLTVVMRK